MRIKPKYPNAENVEFKLTFRTRKILEHYSEYTGLTQSQVLEEIIPQLLEDADFISYINAKRSNARIKRELGLPDE